MFRLLLPLLALATACATNRERQPFDPGRRVHFLVHASPAGQVPLAVAPICTVGPHTVRSTTLTIPAGGEAVEAAFLDVPTAEYRISVYEPVSGAHGRATAEVRHEAWVVLEIDPKTGRSRFGVFFEPPHEEVGSWRAIPAGAR